MISLKNLVIPIDLRPFYELQKCISSLNNNSNAELLANKITNIEYFKNHENQDYLINEIIRFTQLRFNEIEILATMCLLISKDDNFKSFKKMLLDAHKNLFNFHFLRKCYDIHLFDIQDILYLVRSYNIYKRDETFLLFTYFADEIKKADQQLAYDYFIRISAQNSCPGIHFVLVKLTEYTKDDSKKLRPLREIGCEEGSMCYAIRTDNQSAFDAMLVAPRFHVDMETNPNKFEPSDLAYACHYIEYCALYRLPKYFRIFLLKGAKIYDSVRCAIAGGSHEIIRLLHQAGADFSCALHACIDYHRTDVFEWLLSELDEADIPTLLFRAVLSNNIRAIVALGSRTKDPNARDGEGMTVLHHAVRGGCVPVIKFLVDCGVDPNARDARDRIPGEYARGPRAKDIKDLLEKNGVIHPE